jgi:hypothetical protein
MFRAATSCFSEIAILDSNGEPVRNGNPVIGNLTRLSTRFYPLRTVRHPPVRRARIPCVKALHPRHGRYPLHVAELFEASPRGSRHHREIDGYVLSRQGLTKQARQS